ncbi:MAG: hypothetical protein DI533_08855 [Cereibacter sphaeroides]|uniref:Modulator of FtsH protease n=1 Tax=Cereibacter sphaeroides TaxID=1063 RepID=A0A2W5SLZ4_CERSP|nr:MAG: hypothetical protein DI533_08855 [Cereibacter sphaeroides]
MNADDWANFFVAQVGASAALLGLLFVGLSLNLDKILSIGSLPDRAAIGMGLLFTILFMGSLMLVPGQSQRLLGAEVLVVGLVLLLCGGRLELRGLRTGSHRALFMGNAMMFVIAALPYVVGGAFLFIGNSVGFYMIAAAVLLSLMKAVLDAWVLLVEINR